MKHARTLTALCLVWSVWFATGCDSRLLPEATAVEPQSTEGRVEFSLPVQVVTSSRTVDGRQTSSEQAVSSLLAVAFQSEETAAASVRPSGQATSAEDATPFYAAVPIDLNSIMNPISGDDDEADFSFGLGKEGTFHICFLANAKEELSKRLTQMVPGSFTMSQFKNYLADQDPCGADSNGGLLMTSPYFEVTTSFTEPTYLGEVEMTRAMSRVDVENAADGMEITAVWFYNRSDRTRLFNDNCTTLDKDCLQTEPEVYDLTDAPLVGSVQQPALLAASIYSYEQLASVNEATQLPYLDIRYRMPSVSATREYSHKVYFDTTGGIPVPLKRNTLYHVRMVNRGGEPVFSIEVLDWKEGGSVLISDTDLIEGISPLLQGR